MAQTRPRLLPWLDAGITRLNGDARIWTVQALYALPKEEVMPFRGKIEEALDIDSKLLVCGSESATIYSIYIEHLKALVAKLYDVKVEELTPAGGQAQGSGFTLPSDFQEKRFLFTLSIKFLHFASF